MEKQDSISFLKILGRIILFSLTAVSSVWNTNGAEPGGGEYTVQGLLEFRDVRYSTTNKDFYYDTISYGFEATVSGCRWHIKLGTSDPKIYDYRIVSHDGDTTYLLLGYETRQVENEAAGRRGLNVGDATLVKTSLPCFSLAEEAGAVWLAYASGCYFSEHKNDKLKEVPFADYIKATPVSPTEKRVLEDAVIVLADQQPFVPREATYYIQDLVREGFETEKGHGSFTNVVFQTLSTTNFGPLQLPLKAILSIYRPHPRIAPKVESQLCQEVRLYTTNITAGISLTSFKPKLPGKTVISDERFNNGTGISVNYFNTNEWLEEDAVKASEAYAKARRMALASANSPFRAPKSPLLPRVLIIGILAGLPVAMWIFIRGRKTFRAGGEA